MKRAPRRKTASPKPRRKRAAAAVDYDLVLFISGASERSRVALANIRTFADEHLKGAAGNRFPLEAEVRGEGVDERGAIRFVDEGARHGEETGVGRIDLEVLDQRWGDGHRNLRRQQRCCLCGGSLWRDRGSWGDWQTRSGLTSG